MTARLVDLGVFGSIAHQSPTPYSFKNSGKYVEKRPLVFTFLQKTGSAFLGRLLCLAFFESFGQSCGVFHRHAVDGNLRI